MEFSSNLYRFKRFVVVSHQVKIRIYAIQLSRYRGSYIFLAQKKVNKPASRQAGKHRQNKLDRSPKEYSTFLFILSNWATLLKQYFVSLVFVLDPAGTYDPYCAKKR